MLYLHTILIITTLQYNAELQKISGTSATHKGGDLIQSVTDVRNPISTHATHKGGDDKIIAEVSMLRISTHATHKGGDPDCFNYYPFVQ